MRISAKHQMLISLCLIGISLLVWVALLFNPGGIMTIEHCHVSAAGPSAASLEMLLAMNPVSDQLFGWGLMVVAMMLPKLIMPIQQIFAQSLKRKRLASITLFVLGYLILWMLAGVVLVAAIIAFNLWMPLSYLPAIGVLVLTLIWQFSPWKQYFLNKGHSHAVLSAFGWAAYRDALMYGLEHGLWCVGAGWAMMLFPMLLPVGHNAAMIVVTFLMLSEHLEHPKAVQWRFDLRLRLFRYLLAQTRIRLQAINS
jgi:predicted metal-binding membrane protein